MHSNRQTILKFYFSKYIIILQQLGKRMSNTDTINDNPISFKTTVSSFSTVPWATMIQKYNLEESDFRAETFQRMAL
ncbi:hypothetical protein BGS_0534 [Beggiatoa sp. SS]|nr:hypothetical protein BGS_0534 [Beggiatoa sp. SS]